MSKQYDVFISYRREDGEEIARNLQLALEQYHLHVFYDHDELTDGRFENVILRAIESSEVFITLLTPKVFDRCANPNDWVRREIEHAIENDIHIVPVNYNRCFSDFPADTPDTIRNGVGQHEFSEVFSGQHFKSNVRDLVKKRISVNINISSDGDAEKKFNLMLKSNADCTVYINDEPVAHIDGNCKVKGIALRKGKYFIEAHADDPLLEKLEPNGGVLQIESDDLLRLDFDLAPRMQWDERIREEEEVRRKAKMEEAWRNAEEEDRRNAEEEGWLFEEEGRPFIERNGIIFEIIRNNEISVCKFRDAFQSSTWIPSHVAVGGRVFTVTTIRKGAFVGSALTAVIIPDSVQFIDEGAFMDTGLTSITVPKSVISIEDGTFYGCRSLKYVTIPDSVTTIGDRAFCECKNLAAVTIPDSVTTIGMYAFDDCSSLKEVVIENPNCEIGKGAFIGCHPDLKIIRKKSIGKKLKNLFRR